MYHDLEKDEIIVFGCGNVLFGDDGFGPELIRYLRENFDVKENTALIDAGTSIRDILFNIALNELKNLKKIIIIDIADLGKKPGDFIMVGADELPGKDIRSFSMHQVPTSKLIRDLVELKNLDVKLFLVQPGRIPESVSPGLSEELKTKLKEIAAAVMKEIGVPS